MDYYFGIPKASDYVYPASARVRASDMEIAHADQKFVYVNAENDVFEIGGLVRPSENGGEYYRLDALKKADYSDANRALAECTPGGTLRFYTDAPEIAMHVVYRGCCLGMHHFCDRGVYGLDMYVGNGTNRVYCGAAMQTFAENPVENTGVLELPEGPVEVMIEFPLYGGIERLEIGLPNDCFVAPPAPRTQGPIAFYGSSITQGGCVSRPGSMYSNIICRALDCDNANLGFSGSCKGEQYAAEWIGKRELSAFCMDYDYNSYTLEELRERHRPFYETVRRAQPELPIVIVSHPCFWEAREMDIIRRDIVRATYEAAYARGDNVRFVDGCEMFPAPMRDLFSVDNTHPNDLGHYYMAKAIYRALEQI